MTQRAHLRTSHSERGVTLIELMIAITLVAALSTGMLMAMRTSLITYQKTDQRLRSNRQMMSLEQILTREIGGLMPVPAECPGSQGLVTLRPSFDGTPDTLRMVSTFSIAEGARGYPQILEFQVTPAQGGGVRLIVNEHAYTGPSSLRPLCVDGKFLPVEVSASSFVLVDHLRSCQFSYHAPYPPGTFTETPWLPAWDRPALPAGVRIEMTPLAPDALRLPLLGFTFPIHIDRDVFTPPYDAYPPPGN